MDSNNTESFSLLIESVSSLVIIESDKKRSFKFSLDVSCSIKSHENKTTRKTIPIKCFIF